MRRGRGEQRKAEVLGGGGIFSCGAGWITMTF
jgi:hypothetical protein